MSANQRFSVNCPSRLLFAEIADKWSMMLLTVLSDQPRRFNDIKRRLGGIAQKTLTQTLRRLERNGLIRRKVITDSPVAVEYSLTPLGESLLEPFRVLFAWIVDHLDDVDRAREEFDGRS